MHDLDTMSALEDRREAGATQVAHRVTIYVAGKPEPIDTLALRLSRLFGGGTMLPGTGVWLDRGLMLKGLAYRLEFLTERAPGPELREHLATFLRESGEKEALLLVEPLRASAESVRLP